ncbi:MAG: benD [Citricoccus sp.]|nr:benD [Citricoccus sp. WCRC_4]
MTGHGRPEGRFVGKVMVVTGAAQGIGRTVALGAAREGASLVLVDRAEIVHEVRAELEGLGAQALAVTTDLENYSGADSAMAQALDRFGRIDILVNNVGGTIWAKPYAEYREPEIEAEVRRSLFPTLWCCRAVLPAMLKQGGGVIVNVSSVATRGVNRVPYAAATGGVNALTASLAFEYAEHGIRVVGEPNSVLKSYRSRPTTSARSVPARLTAVGPSRDPGRGPGPGRPARVIRPRRGARPRPRCAIPPARSPRTCAP